ncbi:unnamed protein product, partial [Brenthis ino]
MPELIEQMYSSQQIVVPPKFPYILKRYCKAAIKTQPYDLLRWSFEYFSALSQNRPPPVKLRLEYPIYKTEGGLTRGCLKVIANQLSGLKDIPLSAVRTAWQGFCLDPHELNRIFCLCEVYMREDTVPFLHFIAVAGGLLTKSLTHTMILLCETLTKEPDGGSAAIPVWDFLTMYKLLATMDASSDVKYLNGYREGETPRTESVLEEEQTQVTEEQVESEKKLKELSAGKIASKQEMSGVTQQKEEKTEKKKQIEIIVTDEDDNEIPYEIYGEPKEDQKEVEDILGPEEHAKEEETEKISEAERIKAFVDKCYESREERREDLERTFEEIANIVDRFKSANYDLGMIAGRQMSNTSGEFIVANIEKEIMDYVDDQIAILPDPDLKRKKAKPEEVAMVTEILENFLDENMDVIVPEVEEIEEEEHAVPDVIQVYAVPGIGPPVDEDIIGAFQEYALDICKVQADLFMPRNIRHFLCPPLEKYIEHEYEDSQPKEEEVPTGGVITD